MMKTLLWSALAAGLLTSGQASAAYQTFSGIDANGNFALQVGSINSTAAELAFKSNLQGVGTQNFESYAVGADASSIGVFDFQTAGTASFSGSGLISSNLPLLTNGAGRYSVPGGTQFWEVDAGNGFEINFSNQVAAFGFYGIDMGDFSGTLQLELYKGSNLLGVKNVNTADEFTADGSILYFGLISGSEAEDFDRVRFVSTAGTGDIFAFDSFTIGSREQVVPAIPEPSTYALMGMGLVGLCLLRRRRLN